MGIKEVISKIKSYVISFFRQSKATKEDNNPNSDEKIYNINEIDKANFADEIYNYKNTVDKEAYLKADRDIHIGDKIIYENDKKILKYLGNIPTYPEFFIGRDNEVEAIHQRLTTNQNILLLVNGRGGIGKTTLASKYYYTYQKHYQHLVWVFSGMSIVDALLSLALPLGLKFPVKANNDERLSMLLQTMAELNRPCLLIIDNANKLLDIQKYHGELLKCSNFHILLTTRINKELSNTTIYEVKPLEPKAALQLFIKHYKAHDSNEDALFFSIYETVNRNTLVVELLAKNLTNFNDELETEYTLNDLLRDISDNLLQLSKSEKVGTFYQSKETGILRMETPENIITAMYDLGKLDDTEKRLLSIFAVLPAESIPYQTLKGLLSQKRLNKFLLGLFEKGWLDYDTNNLAFRMSPVVQEVVKTKENDLRQNCQELIDKIQAELEQDKLHIENYKYSTVFVKYAISIVSCFKTADYDLCLLAERIGIFYTETGDLNNALLFYKSSQSILKQLLKAYPNDEDYKNGLAISYEKLGDTNASLGNLNKALDFFQRRSQLGKELYESYPNNVSFKNGLAISYSKLGDTNASLGNLNKALDFFQIETTLFEELYESYPNNVSFKNGLAISYAKLAQHYQASNNNQKAYDYFKNAEKLWEELVVQAPQYVQFQKYLEIVRDVLS